MSYLENFLSKQKWLNKKLWKVPLMHMNLSDYNPIILNNLLHNVIWMNDSGCCPS